MAKYWLVGAAWGGTEHRDEKFVQEGYWMLGWEADNPNSSAKTQYEKALNMEVGDRIAIKRMWGLEGDNSKIRILHIGIVKGVIKETNKVICKVDWVAINLKREVDSHGCLQSVHGPYTENDYDGWIKNIFYL